MGSTINGAEDLAKQTKVKYGAVIGGSTIRFFQESNFSTYQRMWATMETAGDSVQNKDNSEGVARVKKENGNYAFLMESVPMEYQTNRECTLQQVGELLDSKGYGIALPISKKKKSCGTTFFKTLIFFRFSISKSVQRGNLETFRKRCIKRIEDKVVGSA